MGYQQPAEFEDLAKRAIDQLRQGSSHVGYRCELQALLLPSKGDCICYEIFTPVRRAEDPVLAIKTVWKKGIDAQKFESPLARMKFGSHLEPTLEHTKIPVSHDYVSALLERASRLAVQVRVAVPSLSLDGTSYELAIGDFWAAARFHWWESPPNQWKGVRDLWVAIKAFMDLVAP
jgi:hypothetical protein